MYCKKCGNKLTEGARFCGECGTPVDSYNNATNAMNPPKSPKKVNKKLFWAITLPIIIVLCLFFGGGIWAGNEVNKISDKVEEYNISYFTSEMQNQKQNLSDANPLNPIVYYRAFIDSNKIKKEAQDASDKIETYTDEWKKLDAEKEQYQLADKYSDYADTLTKFETALNDRDWEYLSANHDALSEEQDALIADYDTYIQNMISDYQSIDSSQIDSSQKDTYEADINKLIQASSEKNYKDCNNLMASIDEIYWQYAESDNMLDVSVQQIDATEFPNVKFYVRVKDPSTDTTPSYLDNKFFFISKKDANGNYIRQTVAKINQLNEKDAIKINMVADISGSMSGVPLSEAKNIMSSFVNSVQFSAGDEVELTAFSTGVYLVQEFCNDPTLLNNHISNLRTDDMTSLYDALYTAVTRTASQSGAKCVIAFTDGMDNYSKCSAQDVIDVSKRYQVPVFIIGVDIYGYDDAEQIAKQTGGKYYNASSINSMEDIYDDIYEQEKELYVIEYTDEDNDDLTNESQLRVGYHSKEYGGECNYNYTPNILLNVESSAIYANGPEAVVEAYMKNFDSAMTNQDFSAISPYLLEDSNIYDAQKEYVKKGIMERLDSCEISNVNYLSKDQCIVTTRETYYVQKSDSPLQLMTQQCDYIVNNVNGEWKMVDFADAVEVLFKINT